MGISHVNLGCGSLKVYQFIQYTVRLATVMEKVMEKIFFQDHGKVREFCLQWVKMSNFEKVRENQSWSGNFHLFFYTFGSQICTKTTCLRNCFLVLPVHFYLLGEKGYVLNVIPWNTFLPPWHCLTAWFGENKCPKLVNGHGKSWFLVRESHGKWDFLGCGNPDSESDTVWLNMDTLIYMWIIINEEFHGCPYWTVVTLGNQAIISLKTRHCMDGQIWDILYKSSLLTHCIKLQHSSLL